MLTALMVSYCWSFAPRFSTPLFCELHSVFFCQPCAFEGRFRAVTFCGLGPRAIAFVVLASLSASNLRFAIETSVRRSTLVDEETLSGSFFGFAAAASSGSGRCRDGGITLEGLQLSLVVANERGGQGLGSAARSPHRSHHQTSPSAEVDDWAGTQDAER